MAKTNKKIYIKTRDGNIQTICLYSDKNDVLKSGATNFLAIRNGGESSNVFAALGDLNHPKASKLRYGNKAVLMKSSMKEIIDLSSQYRMADLYPDIYTTMTRIPDEENTVFIMGNRKKLEYMFSNCLKLTSVPLFDTSKVTNMGDMFSNCSSLTSVPLFDTSSVNYMDSMFSNCSSLTSVPLFDTSKVIYIGYMFNNCSSLTSVPLFDTSSVNYMHNMFSNCSSLTSVPAFDIRNVKNIRDMLKGTKITSVTFRNKPTNLEINSQILCGNPNQIKTINFI